jgi:hypothetical protein
MPKSAVRIDASACSPAEAALEIVQALRLGG